MEDMEEFILSLCDEIMLAYQYGFVKGLEIGIDTGNQLSKEDGQHKTAFIIDLTLSSN